MVKNSYETVIVGGGISGLACARRLIEKGRDFLLISEDIGGRILTSKDGDANLGAFFVYSDFYHFLKYVKKLGLNPNKFIVSKFNRAVL